MLSRWRSPWCRQNTDCEDLQQICSGGNLKSWDVSDEPKIKLIANFIVFLLSTIFKEKKVLTVILPAHDIES